MQDGGHDHVQHTVCLPNPGCPGLIHPELFVSFLVGTNQAKLLHGTSHGHIKKPSTFRNVFTHRLNVEGILALRIHGAVFPALNGGKIKPQRASGRRNVDPQFFIIPFSADTLLQIHEDNNREFKAFALMHRHDADKVVPDTHGGMIVAVTLLCFTGFTQGTDEIGQTHVAGLLSVQHSLIKCIQVCLPRFSIRIGSAGSVYAGFPHQPPDEVRNGHTFADLSPYIQLIGHLFAADVNWLFIPFHAQLEGFVERHIFIFLQTDVR